jgi:hypothetical protein
MDGEGVDERLRELAEASPDFGRLYEYQPLLVIYGSQAELTVLTNPNKAGAQGQEDEPSRTSPRASTPSRPRGPVSGASACPASRVREGAFDGSQAMQRG